jgi:hypothetical protein
MDPLPPDVAVHNRVTCSVNEKPLPGMFALSRMHVAFMVPVAFDVRVISIVRCVSDKIVMSKWIVAGVGTLASAAEWFALTGVAGATFVPAPELQLTKKTATIAVIIIREGAMVCPELS